MVVLNEESRDWDLCRNDRVAHSAVCLQVVRPSPVAILIEEAVAELSDEMMLQHPEYLIGDLPIVVAINGGRQRDGNDVKLWIGLILCGDIQRVPLRFATRRLRYAAEPCHIRLTSQ